QRQASINHHRELPIENGNVFGRHFGATQAGQGELLALFLDRARHDSLAAQRRRKHLLVFGSSFSRNLLARCGRSAKRKYWHRISPVEVAPAASANSSLPTWPRSMLRLCRVLSLSDRSAIPRARTAAQAYATIDHLLQLVRHRRSRHRGFQRNLL